MVFFIFNVHILSYHIIDSVLQLSTSEVLTAESFENDFSDDQLYVFRQAIKHVSYSLKRYFEAHACIMADRIRITMASVRHNSPTPEITPYKVNN